MLRSGTCAPWCEQRILLEAAVHGYHLGAVTRGLGEFQMLKGDCEFAGELWPLAAIFAGLPSGEPPSLGQVGVMVAEALAKQGQCAKRRTNGRRRMFG